jgi:photosystem II stability/assembly factor-like uncharacterized protein
MAERAGRGSIAAFRWEAQASAPPPSSEGISLPSTPSATRLVMGWNGAVLLSGNRGATWKARRITSKQLRAGWLGDDGFAIVVGADGVMLTNPPGLADWTERDSGTSRDLNGVIRSGNSLVVVGDEGEILGSTDMGATWTKGTRGSKHLNAVA